MRRALVPSGRGLLLRLRPVSARPADVSREVPRVVRHRVVDAPVDAVWARVGNLREHERLIPLTEMAAPDRVLRAGDRVVAVSARLVVDRMTVESVREGPGGARWAALKKTGPLLGGEAHVVVRPWGPDRTLVVWAEDVTFAPSSGTAAGWLVDRVQDRVLAAMCDFALWRLDRLLRA